MSKSVYNIEDSIMFSVFKPDRPLLDVTRSYQSIILRWSASSTGSRTVITLIDLYFLSKAELMFFNFSFSKNSM